MKYMRQCISSLFKCAIDKKLIIIYKACKERKKNRLEMDHLLRVVEGIAGNSNLWGELSFAFMQIQKRLTLKEKL